MNFSKRNPLLRTNVEELNEVVGSLGQEISEQNLDAVEGGAITPSSGACIKLSVEAVTAVTAVAGWVNKKTTAKYKCGGVLTATAECFRC